MDIMTLKKGETKNLNKETTITFVSHSHKKARIDGPPSPLIMYIEYEYQGKKEQKQHNLITNYESLKKEKTGWKWNNIYFILIKYSYNDFIQFEFYFDSVPGKYKHIFGPTDPDTYS
jgi:hypothetical protein